MKIKNVILSALNYFYFDTQFVVIFKYGKLFQLAFMSHHYFFTIMRLLELQVLPAPNEEWAENTTKELKDDLFVSIYLNNNSLLKRFSRYSKMQR